MKRVRSLFNWSLYCGNAFGEITKSDKGAVTSHQMSTLVKRVVKALVTSSACRNTAQEKLRVTYCVVYREIEPQVQTSVSKEDKWYGALKTGRESGAT